MRYGIPVFGSRIAPRCTIADGMLVLTLHGNRLTERERVDLEHGNWQEILSVVRGHRVDTLVCGGIARNEKSLLAAQDVEVVENVACTTDEVVAAIVAGCLRSGLGFGEKDVRVDHDEDPAADTALPDTMDCLECRDRVCLRGLACRPGGAGAIDDSGSRDARMLESARDIALEDERILCRLSELIYFCLEMRYRRIGLAYCVELTEAARILTAVLRRLFEVVPVCCKVGGVTPDDPLDARAGRPPRESPGEVACNPREQAAELERAGCDFNVIVGLCLGVDCVFSRATTVPFTTLFVKDRSLANNPIGAIYSDYYLKEAIRSAAVRSGAPIGALENEAVSADYTSKEGGN